MVFFIFLVSNIGGLLTPLGDPPLFLGFLHGVPFFWTLRLWPVWLVTVGLVLATFIAIDLWHWREEAVHPREELIVRDPWGAQFRSFWAVWLARSSCPHPGARLLMLLMGCSVLPVDGGGAFTPRTASRSAPSKRWPSCSSASS